MPKALPQSQKSKTCGLDARGSTSLATTEHYLFIFLVFRAGPGFPAFSFDGRAVNQRLILLILRGLATNDVAVLVGHSSQ